MLPQGSWIHLAATFQAAPSGFGTVKWYRNGTLVLTDSSCVTGQALVSNQPLQIGREFVDNSANGRFFRGLIDEARVDNRVLLDSEVTALMNNYPLVVLPPGLVGNDSDPDSAVIMSNLETPPAHGTLQLNVDGSFTYAPAAGFSGTDTFTYRASDGLSQSASPATVTITVNSVSGPVQFDISGLLNADVVINNGNGGNDPSQDAIDGSGHVFMSQSYATAVLGGSGNGLPDNGFFPANADHPGVQLYATNTNDGFNARLSLAPETYTIYAPNRQYVRSRSTLRPPRAMRA